MSTPSLVKRITPRTRLRLFVATGAVVALAAAGVAVGLAHSASAATPAFDPHDAITPVVSYTFDTASGTTVADTSGKSNTGAWKGTPSYVAGISGTAAAVSSGTNYVKLPLVAGQTDAASSFSYEFWILEQSRTSYGPIVSNQDFNSCNDKGMTLYNHATQGVLEACWGLTSGGTREYVTGYSSNLVGAWHHVAVAVDRVANSAVFYVDGVQKATAAAGSITASTVFNSGYAFNVGGFSGSEADTADGYTSASIDDFNFFNAAIPASQVAADYAASRPNAVAYSVAFNGNGAGSGSMTAESMPAGQALPLTTNSFTRSGYQFAGWATSASGPVYYTDQQTVSNLTATSGATITLYAVWNRFRAVGDSVAPIVSYDFDSDTGSTVADSSGNGNNGAWSGTSTYATGISGKAAYVNSPAGSVKGVNFFSLPLLAGKTDASSSFSYVFWLNEVSSSTDSPIVSNQNFTHCYDQGSTLYNTDSGGVLRACFGQSGTSTTQDYLPNVSASSVIGNWHQVAVVADRSAGTMTTYLDGQFAVQSTTLTSAFTLASGYPFRVGAEGSGSDTVDGFVDASIDDFDFYSVPVTAAQVLNDYNATKPSIAPTNSGSTIGKGFVSDTFRAPSVQAGATVLQPVGGLWNGSAVTSYTKISGDAWLTVGTDGTVTGTAPATVPADPATVTVQATDGTTTSQITLEFVVIGAHDSPQLATATWNLWDAGTHVSDSTLKDLAVIAANGLDEIGVQEDGGTLATTLAHALGWYAVEGDAGVGIVSAYPLDTSTRLTVGAGSVPAVAVTAQVPGRDVRLWSVGLDSTALGSETACPTGASTPAALVTAEKRTVRYAQAKSVSDAIATDTASASRIPVLMLGDLESPAAADWTSATSAAHCGVGAVDWPVTNLFRSAGLTDSYRAVSTNPVTDPGLTWSTFETTNPTSGTAEPQDRIDYVDFAGAPLTELGANTLVAGWPVASNLSLGSWTSDHRAVVATFQLAAVPPPTVTVTTSRLVYQAGSAPSRSAVLAATGAASPTAGAVLQVDMSSVDFTTPGSYAVALTATDPSSGLTSAPASITVVVVPVITITLSSSSAAFALASGQRVTSSQVQSALNPSINVPGTITVDISAVNSSAPGSYRVVVGATDAYGFSTSINAVVSIALSVPVSGSTPPAGTIEWPGLAFTGVELLLPLALSLLLLVLGAVVIGVRRLLRRRRS